MTTSRRSIPTSPEAGVLGERRRAAAAAAARFDREVRAPATLQHPNVASIYGLARAWLGDGMGDSGLEFSPTVTAAMTQAGTIPGTAAYMSPGQTRGRHVDRWTDIRAFGVFLWEMATGRRETTPFLQSPYNEAGASFSPDGRWVASMSDVSGDADIYVRPHPGPGNPVRVSLAGGHRAVWSREAFALTKEFTNANGAPIPTPDGKRFLATRFNMDARQSQIKVMFDWAGRLRKLAPAGGC